MSKSIEQDNREKLDFFKDHAPSASYISGFIDGDGCIFIRKIRDGYQSGITIAQSRTNILQIVQQHFGGSITTSSNRNCNTVDKMTPDGYFDKYNVRNEYNLMIRSNEYFKILEYIKDCVILKQLQIDALYAFSSIVNSHHNKAEKERLFAICSEKRKVFDFDFSRLNAQYIQGLFDAEGCVFIDRKKFSRYKISIAQKNYPAILHKIQEFLGYGTVTDEFKFVIYDKSKCLQFLQMVKPGVIVKYNQVVAFETFLTTSDMEIKEHMYRITNEEKHKIEHFTELNQKKENLPIPIKIEKEATTKKEMYIEKSQAMMGEGNHNFGKHFSEETKHKMSTSIRHAKCGVSDEIILKVRQLIEEGNTNIKIQELLNLPRHTVSRIKNGILSCRDEEKKERTPMTQEESNISKRKIILDEILFIITKVCEGQSGSSILQQIENPLATIHIVNNIRKSMREGKMPIYESELPVDVYKQYASMAKEYSERK